MLTKSNRLRSGKDIARVYKQGSYGAGAKLLSVKALKSGRAITRTTVVVAKKIDKRATVRNRLRRRLIEEFRRQLETVTPGYDIVITVHADFDALGAPELAGHLRTALSRAGVITT